MPSQKLQQKFNKVQSNFRKYEEIPEDWNLKTLNEIGKVSGGGTPDTKEKKYWGGKIRWAIPSDLTNLEKNFIENTERTITQLGLDESSANLFKPGTILLSSRATVGVCKINTVPMATNQGFQNIECNESFDNLYVLYSIQYNKIKLIRYAFGTTFLEISKNNVKKVKLACPEFPEQQKIASILSNTDDSIQKTTEQLEKTKQLKTGLMQKLLTKGIGHTKFKETIFGPRFLRIQIPKDWECDLLENHSDVHVGHVGPTSEYYCDDGVVFLRTQNVRENMPDLADVLHITRQFHLEHKKSQLLPKDILVSRVGNSGVACVIPDDFPEANCANVLILRKKESLDTKFFCYFLNSHIAQLEITSREAGGVQLVLNVKTLEKLSIPILPLEEQQKIASILSNADSQIESLQSKKSQLQKTKRGLMQKLLTGKIRVPLN